MKGRSWRLLCLLGWLAAALACHAPVEPFWATATPLSTCTPTLTPTSTSPPPPTPTPTPAPAEQFAAAEQAMRNGDYQTAAAIYRGLAALSDGEIAKRARLGLGMAHLRDGAYGEAVVALRDWLAAYPEDELTRDVHFMLAEALMGAGDPLAAANEYRLYLAGETTITDYVHGWLGDALAAAGDSDGAVEAYRAAIAANPDPYSVAILREKIAQVYLAIGDYTSAVAEYDAILDLAESQGYGDAFCARIERQAAETLLLAGEVEAGYDRHLSVVETYPTTHAAYLSLVTLVEAGRPVDDYLRGLVDYYGGAYGAAVGALYRYINAYPDTHRGDAHWYAGLSFLAAGSFDLAASEFEMLIETHPGDGRVGDAWMGLAQAYVNMGDAEAAVETYRRFAEAIPGHPRAPEALWRAARLLESEGDREAAAEAFMDCHVRYPNSPYGPPALFRSGLQSYRLGDWTGAAVAWDTLAQTYPDALCYPPVIAWDTLAVLYPADSPCRLVAVFWLGKARLAQGDLQAAAAAFDEVHAVDPLGYYGLRAADLMMDPLAPVFSPREYAPAYDEAVAQAEAEEWLAGWLGSEDEMNDMGTLPPELANDSRLQRGLELWRLGRFGEAREELEILRRATYSDPLTQYRLALLFRDIGLYRSSLLCAKRVIALSPAANALDAPAFLARLAYPIYYEDLVLQNAGESGLDPLLLFALIWQESQFESLALSSSGAHGLMQVMPATGDQIAAELGWPPGYETSDLTRPYVSLRFGVYYLARQRDRFGGRLDAALAGYNGGPANAQVWLEDAGEDPDLFFEMISLRQPRLYLQGIREHLAVYQALYGE